VLQTRRVALRARKEGCANFFSQREKNPIKWVQSPISHRLKSKRIAPIKHHREQLYRHFFARITRIIHGVFVNDLILGRNERVLIRIDGFRRPKIFHSPHEKGAKKNRKRALSSDSVSLTLNVLKYVVAFFGPFWRKPRVNMFLVPCLRPLLRALWLPMFVYVLFR